MQNILLITLFYLLFSINFNSPNALFAEEKTLTHAAQEFLTAPQLLTQEEISECIKGVSLDMAFHQDASNYFRFITSSDDVYFELVFDEKLPDSYSEAEKKLFIERVQIRGSNTHKQFIFSYRVSTAHGEEVNLPIIDEEKTTSDSDSYLVSKRRIIEDGTPQKITEEELQAILRKDRVIFYTGAGISIASGVPAMSGLCSLLGIEEGEKSLMPLTPALTNPQEFASQIKIFHDACFNSPPSKAHTALKEIALLKNCQIVTENLDTLHERSGIMPYRVHARHLREEIDPATLNEIDYLICMGLSHDDRGFIGWYKKHHPEGKIISIDLSTPSYLDNDDFLLQGDLQEVVPHLLY